MAKLHKEGRFSTNAPDSNVRSRSKSSYMSGNIISGSLSNPVITRASGACHGPLRSTQFENRMKDSIGLITMTDPERLKDSGIKEFYDWVINKSIWCDAFICKDVEANIEHGFLKRTDLPGSYFLGAAQFSRMSTSELKSSLPVIAAMVNEDYEVPFSVLACILVNWNVSLDNDDGYLFTESFRNTSTMNEDIRFGEVPHWPFKNEFNVRNVMSLIWNDFEKRSPIKAKVQYPMSKSKYTYVLNRDQRWNPDSNDLPYKREGYALRASCNDHDDFNFFKQHFMCSSPSSFVRDFNKVCVDESYKEMFVEHTKRRIRNVDSGSGENLNKPKRVYLNFAALEDYCFKALRSLKKKGIAV